MTDDRNGPGFPEEGEYVLTQDWPGEAERLALLEAMVDPLCRRALTAAGVRPGLRCLEFGAGSGSVARWLADRVGDPALVTATDVDLGLLGPLAAAGVTVRRHDVVVDDFPPGSFDLIHSRAVLEHLPAREAVLDRLAGWLAPDGVLVVTDCAIDTTAAVPAPVGAALQAWIEVLGITGTDYAWACGFPDPLVQRSYRDVGVEWLRPDLVGGGPVARFWALTVERLRVRIVAAGLADDAVVDAALARLADAAFVAPAPAFVATWGRRPVPGS